MSSGLNFRKIDSLSSLQPDPQQDAIAEDRPPEDLQEYTDGMNGVAPKQGHLISKILAPALKLWLRSQLDSIENLQLTLGGGNRQILSGSIPTVSISASHAIYQGIHLSQISLQGRGIRFNIRDVLKGKPLHPIDPVLIDAQLQLSQADLDASLTAPLFVQAVQEFLGSWLQSHADSWNHLRINLGCDRLIVTGDRRLVDEPANATARSVEIEMGLEIRNGHQLYLVNPQLQVDGEAIAHLEDFSWDLGSQVIISQFTLMPGQLTCQGQITLTP